MISTTFILFLKLTRLQNMFCMAPHKIASYSLVSHRLHPPTQLASPYVKAEDLSMLFEQMAQSFLKVLAPQRSTTNHASSSTNAQAMTMLDPLSCAFCSQSSHFTAQCLVCADYITNEKCKRNLEGKIVLPNGQFTPRSIPG
jgi:hypothetical protein